MKCPNCGNENPPDYLFCDECGARLIGNDVAAATGDDSGGVQPQDAGGGGGDTGGVTPYVSDTAESNVDSPIATYGDYNVGMGMGTGDTVAEGIDEVEEQSGSTGASAAPADSTAAPVGAVPVTEDTVSTGQDMSGEQDSGQQPVQAMDQNAAADDGSGGMDAGSDRDSAAADSTLAYQDAASGITGIEDDARQAVDEDVADLGNMDWLSSPPSVVADAGSQMANASSGAQGSSGGDTSGNDWAAHALSLLDQAQGAISSGDWSAFGSNMSDLRAALQSVAGGPGGMSSMQGQMGASTSSTGQAGSGNAAGTTMDAGQAAWNGAADTSSAAVPSYAAPMPSSEPMDYGASGASPVAGMTQGSDQSMSSGTGGTGAGMGAGPDAGYMGGSVPQADTMGSGSMGDSSTADQEPTLAPAIQPIAVGSTGSAPMTSGAPAGTGARLILISSGAEMALPDQEEITVGREDPSSGIFPDVDLTPHGGEDGGVSRRHARLLHVGDDYFVEDLQSTNFTKLDGQRLPAHVRERLDDGARIDFGRVAMIFRRG
jgi:hypothetical protein